MLCDRELAQFFLFYLRCNVSCYLTPKNKSIPENITDMLEYTDVVGSLVLNDGMRIVSDYKDKNFAGLAKDGYFQSAIHGATRNSSSVNCSVYVTLKDKNFSGYSYIYQKGTDDRTCY